MLHALSLGFVLYFLWILLSGHFDPLLLGLGVVSAAAVVFIAHRMDLIDHEGHPVHLSWRLFLYWPWLIKEIVKANLDVALLIVNPKMPISPNMLEVKGSQKSELGQVIYANSITLTPGTVTVELEKGMFSVHALTHQAADGVRNGEMDRRVTGVEGHLDPVNEG
ncbi:MAG: Na+/H+ antiporter subunit E [Rhodospirillales bacterium]